MFVDTYSNLVKCKPAFCKSDGRFTAYALHCGSVQRITNENHWLELYHEHNFYHVRFGPANQQFHKWEVFDTINEAWKLYNAIEKSFFKITGVPDAITSPEGTGIFV